MSATDPSESPPTPEVVPANPTADPADAPPAPKVSASNEDAAEIETRLDMAPIPPEPEPEPETEPEPPATSGSLTPILVGGVLGLVLLAALLSMAG